MATLASFPTPEPTADGAVPVWLRGDVSLAVPMLPDLAYRVIELTSDPEVPISKLAGLVSKDQVLASRVLGLANSAYSASIMTISTVTDAIVRLGTVAVRNVVVTVSFTSKMHDPAMYGARGRGLADHALGTAYLSRLIADGARVNGEEAFLFGLLHDIGKLVILKLAHDHRRRTQQAVPDAEIQQALIERHTALGALALRRWKLPEALDEPVMYHHDWKSAPERQQESAVCYFANLLAHRYGFGCPKEERDLLADDVCERLRIDAERLASLDQRAPGLVQVAKQALG